MGERYRDPKKEFVVHPDMIDAFKSYNGDKDHFEKAFEKRRELTAKGEPYWNTDHDVEMKETAEERSKNPLWRFSRK